MSWKKVSEKRPPYLVDVIINSFGKAMIANWSGRWFDYDNSNGVGIVVGDTEWDYLNNTNED